MGGKHPGPRAQAPGRLWRRRSHGVARAGLPAARLPRAAAAPHLRLGGHVDLDELEGDLGGQGIRGMSRESRWVTGGTPLEPSPPARRQRGARRAPCHAPRARCVRAGAFARVRARTAKPRLLLQQGDHGALRVGAQRAVGVLGGRGRGDQGGAWGLRKRPRARGSGPGSCRAWSAGGAGAGSGRPRAAPPRRGGGGRSAGSVARSRGEGRGEDGRGWRESAAWRAAWVKSCPADEARARARERRARGRPLPRPGSPSEKRKRALRSTPCAHLAGV